VGTSYCVHWDRRNTNLPSRDHEQLRFCFQWDEKLGSRPQLKGGHEKTRSGLVLNPAWFLLGGPLWLVKDYACLCGSASSPSVPGPSFVQITVTYTPWWPSCFFCNVHRRLTKHIMCYHVVTMVIVLTIVPLPKVKFTQVFDADESCNCAEGLINGEEYFQVLSWSELTLPDLAEFQPLLEVLPPVQETKPRSVRKWKASLWQFARFSIVGILNTLIDVITLNILLWRFPTHSPNLLLVYNSFAYILGALNSFCLNKYWTFRHRNITTSGEIVRFAVISIAGILCNDIILWLVARSLHPLITNNLLWVNISKGMAIVGTMTISYLGMRLWVFINFRRWKPLTQSYGSEYTRMPSGPDVHDVALLNKATRTFLCEQTTKRERNTSREVFMYRFNNITFECFVYFVYCVYFE
jgi:putative flippase GtrA